MNWIVLKALNELYTKGVVAKNATIVSDSEIQFLINSINVVQENRKDLLALNGYNGTYEAKYKSNYDRYYSFLSENRFLKPQSRFEKEDIEILIRVKALTDSGDLNDLRNQIIASDESLRGISLMFFRNEKYLLSRPAIVSILKEILGVEHFSNEKDQQYIYKLECHNTVSIILCENLDFLTKPNKSRANGLELWYAGGKNVNKLQYADHRGLPIYYSCDWDYDGLFVIYPLVKRLIPEIKLLSPNGISKGIVQTGHSSVWETKDVIGRIRSDQSLFDSQEILTIQELIRTNSWIIEESNDLIKMVALHSQG